MKNKKFWLFVGAALLCLLLSSVPLLALWLTPD
ncbi:hypothetical protein PMI40_04888 [Herbaspirillum sp. YR522]|nr:hypothetical protein PMI40_04888 [Herbaspirillum sp. YR522]